MRRRGLGRGRILIGIGAVLAILSMWLPWFTVGGEVLPALTGNGFDGAGVLLFVAAVGMLALIALPYAQRNGQSSLDRPAAFAALVAIGLVGLGLEIIGSLNEGRLGGPDRAAGLWLGGVGMILATWGAAEMYAEKPSPL